MLLDIHAVDENRARVLWFNTIASRIFPEYMPDTITDEEIFCGFSGTRKQ